MSDNLTPAQRSNVMSRIRSYGNEATEQRFVRLLRASGSRGWRRNVRLAGKPDLVFGKERVAVFLDGCFWHACPRCYVAPKSNRRYWREKIAGNAARDRRVTAQLRRGGWRVVRIWQHQIRLKPAVALRRVALARARVFKANHSGMRAADLAQQ